MNCLNEGVRLVSLESQWETFNNDAKSHLKANTPEGPWGITGYGSLGAP